MRRFSRLVEGPFDRPTRVSIQPFSCQRGDKSKTKTGPVKALSRTPVNHLSVANSDAHAWALVDTVERPSVDHGFLGDLHGSSKRRPGLERVHALEVVDALLLHLGQVACDPAVVTNQAAFLGFGILHVGGMNEAPGRFAARGAEPIPKGLAILARKEPVLEPDVDV